MEPRHTVEWVSGQAKVHGLISSNTFNKLHSVFSSGGTSTSLNQCAGKKMTQFHEAEKSSQTEGQREMTQIKSQRQERELDRAQET